jgi:hypothetical protein
MRRLAIIVLIALLISTPALAQTATPTPTPTGTPVPWFTPTPLATVNPADYKIDIAGIDFEYEYSKMMESSVQMWQTSNQTGMLTLLQATMLFMMTIWGLWQLYEALQDDD